MDQRMNTEVNCSKWQHLAAACHAFPTTIYTTNPPSAYPHTHHPKQKPDRIRSALQTMWNCRTSWRVFPTVCAQEENDGTTVPRGMSTLDKLANNRPKILVTDADIYAYLDQETGRDRVRKMYTKLRPDTASPELELVLQSCKATFGLVFCLSSVFGAREARQRYMESHKHVKFETKFKAHRRLHDAVLFGGLKQGLIWGLRASVFSGLFMCVSQTFSVYRNKTSPLDYVLGGCVTGSLLKVNLGLRGMIGGGFVGGALGLVGGLFIYGMLLAAGETQQKRHYWQVENLLREKRQLQSAPTEVQSDVTHASAVVTS